MFKDCDHIEEISIEYNDFLSLHTPTNSYKSLILPQSGYADIMYVNKPDNTMSDL